MGTGKDGRILKGDVLSMLEAPTSEAPMPEAPAVEARTAPVSVPVAELAKAEREERVPMSRLRQRVAERLKMAQDTTAMLTTFNEVDMTALSEMRATYKVVLHVHTSLHTVCWHLRFIPPAHRTRSRRSTARSWAS